MLYLLRSCPARARITTLAPLASSAFIVFDARLRPRTTDSVVMGFCSHERPACAAKGNAMQIKSNDARAAIISGGGC